MIDDIPVTGPKPIFLPKGHRWWDACFSTYGGFLSHRGTPRYHPYFSGVFSMKSTIQRSRGTPISGNHGIYMKYKWNTNGYIIPQYPWWISVHPHDWRMDHGLCRFDSQAVPMQPQVMQAPTGGIELGKTSTAKSHPGRIFVLVGGEWLPFLDYIFPEILGMECHHPNWRTNIFFRGVAKNHQPVCLFVLFSLIFWSRALIFFSQLFGQSWSVLISNSMMSTPDEQTMVHEFSSVIIWDFMGSFPKKNSGFWGFYKKSRVDIVLEVRFGHVFKHHPNHFLVTILESFCPFYLIMFRGWLWIHGHFKKDLRQGISFVSEILVRDMMNLSIRMSSCFEHPLIYIYILYIYISIIYTHIYIYCIYQP